MKIAFLIGIIICLLTLIGVLIHAIKNNSINLPEIIVGVITAVFSVLLAVTFNGNTKENTENAFKIRLSTRPC